MTEPIDEAHAISIDMLAFIRETFDAKKAEIREFRHTLGPPAPPEPDEQEEEVQEWTRRRPWFRT